MMLLMGMIMLDCFKKLMLKILIFSLYFEINYGSDLCMIYVESLVMAGKNLICRNWTYFRWEKSLQSLVRVISADSYDILSALHVKVFFYFFNFQLSNPNSLCHLKSLKRHSQIEIFLRHHWLLCLTIKLTFEKKN